MRQSKNGFQYRGTQIKVCEFCSIDFESLKPGTRFCSISCWNRSTKPEYKRICSGCLKELIYKSPQSFSLAKRKNTKCRSCSKIDEYLSPDARDRLRKKRIKELNTRHGQITPNYNPEACKAIDEFGYLHGFEFKHAENGGEFYINELGYWVDGYDVERNVVIEYDELHHRAQTAKDARREKRIIEHLKCTFIRIGPCHDS